MTTLLIFIPIAFALGSIPFSLLIGLARGVDIRTTGSRNIGATNLGRTLGGRYFALGFTCDTLKGLIPALAAGFFADTLGSFEVEPTKAWLWLAVAVAAVLGHSFSPWVRFKGGKGVATGLGAMLGVFPALTIPAIGAALIFLFAFLLWRFVSLASIAAAIALPIFTWLLFGTVKRIHETNALTGIPPEQLTPDQAELLKAQATAALDPLPFFAVALLLALLVIVRHRANITRLLAGTEPRIGSPKAGQ